MWIVASIIGFASLTTTAAQDWQALIAQLRDGSAAKRMAAVRQLNAANYLPAAQYIAPLLTDPDDNVQFSAIDAEISFFTNEPIESGVSGSRALEAFNAGPLVRSAMRGCVSTRRMRSA
ncbi:MAG: hypothetical protein JF610_17430 [Acidobacteria bacterium]|nr:hypothetical protein [Acidobacteriota bacterium]